MSKKLDAKDAFGARFKKYEAVYDRKLIDRLFTIIRIDGKNFSGYTKKLNRPFDKGLSDDMFDTTKYLVSEIQGCIFGYTQSDEITLILYTADNINSQLWFDGEVKKILTISASLATSHFNNLRIRRFLDRHAYEDQMNDESMVIDKEFFYNLPKPVQFDSRVFQVPDVTEAINSILLRQQDATKNSISQTASALYSHEELKFKNGKDKQELIFQKGDLLKNKMIQNGFSDLIDINKSNFNWNDMPVGLKRGRTVLYQTINEEITEEKAGFIKQKDPENGNLNYTNYIGEGPKYFLKKKGLVEIETPIFSHTDNLINYLLKVTKTYEK